MELEREVLISLKLCAEVANEYSINIPTDGMPAEGVQGKIVSKLVNLCVNKRVIGQLVSE
jgi:hypothetical protein